MNRRILGFAAAASLIALVAPGCAVGHDPRVAALGKAQHLYDAGRYSKALQATELAEASADPDPVVVAGALVLRARCLEALGQREPAAAHYRYVVDQYPSSELVAFQVNEDGGATQIRVLSAPHPLLGGAAIDAISRARVDPMMLGLTDRNALPALRQTKINFELE